MTSPTASETRLDGRSADFCSMAGVARRISTIGSNGGADCSAYRSGHIVQPAHLQTAFSSSVFLSNAGSMCRLRGCGKGTRPVQNRRVT